MIEMIRLAGIGVVLGIVTIIPGISTSTIAVVFNVYDRLIGVITPNIKKIAAAWKFLLPLAAGVVLGIVLFSKAVTWLFNHFDIPTYWFFIGIISGSLPSVYQRAGKPDSVFPSVPSAICCVIALGVMVLTAVLKPAEDAAVYTVLTLPVFTLLAAGGAIGAAAMIVPGISGAFVLLVIGLYRTFIQAVSDLNFPILAPAVLGAGVGLLLGAALVRFLLKKAPKQTYGAVLGLVAGSVIVLFPGGFGNGIIIVFSLVSCLAGFAVSFFSGRKGKEP